MSNSFRKQPIFGITTSVSEKQDKRLSNRKIRRKTKTLLIDIDRETELPIFKAEGLNVWQMGKDGKHYWKNATERDMRK